MMNATESRARYVNLRRDDGTPVDLQVRLCDTYLCRLRGLMFRRALKPKEGLLFVEKLASIVGTSIHMFFVPFPIAVIWFDSAGVVVDSCIAKPWRPYYAPRKAARFYLEAAPEVAEAFRIGDHVDIPLS